MLINNVQISSLASLTKHELLKCCDLIKSIEINKTHGVRLRPNAFIPSPRGGRLHCTARESRRKLRFPPTATAKQTSEMEMLLR